MTKPLDLAIADVRKLSAVDQDETAEMLLWSIEMRSGSLSLDSETIAAIDESLARGGASSPRTLKLRRSGSAAMDDRPLYAASERRSDGNPQLS